MDRKLKVGILGTGNIGTDLMMKVIRSDVLECKAFVGRNLNSSGMRKAVELGIPISDRSIDAFTSGTFNVDLVFDATSAQMHKKHAPIFESMGILAIDMTPSQVGDMCVPAINLKKCITNKNLNMVTCGGQASIPLAYTLKKVVPSIEYIETVSAISSNSAGPGTRANLDEYINNTEAALSYFAECDNVKAIINLNPAKPHIDMQTTVFAKVDSCDIDKVRVSIEQCVSDIQKYVPGYKLIVEPVYESGRIMIMVRVKGAGDYLPKYAGNLDIINCAAISVAEEYAKGITNDE
ncbi:acetaldehyde dehydrogenase (acetylating) [Vibrio neptunius]|uniref:Acetaldehyde dehydrogenase n=1 Tax=Vibrio neptunius TaxID=170651 RepID=A0ABS3A4T7_9VIBR|nr:acetaldehyde dehydrogenase (acetylating) [Vibrio neptunius]MBN3493428.1 acetaldehyde dehydrogenase (acetylating) [Vibrio neptunius]MBN3515878.1 acetaldehyde dehydrogenase (acetylating) [Vibrio neptunius]MBN3550097.1 acetaldehyde dehydrogenase (acetylating) [Vibrio neptunius]MBN3578183.1 acetaldehyde dehydrogenase (acetylating) [Vibrio neptunius]MCH9871847.1 acetaldehyde dehydrogenase (acetylating) [Vibrio neptunius]